MNPDDTPRVYLEPSIATIPPAPEPGEYVAASTKWTYGTEAPTHWLDVPGFPTFFDFFDGYSWLAHQAAVEVEPIEPSWGPGTFIVPIDGIYNVSASVMLDFGPGSMVPWPNPGHGQIEMSLVGQANGVLVDGPDYTGITGNTEWSDRTSWIVLPEGMSPSYGRMSVGYNDTLWIGAGEEVNAWQTVSINMPGLYYDGEYTQRRAYAACTLVMPWERERGVPPVST